MSKKKTVREIKTRNGYATKRSLVRELYKNGMSKKDIIKGMKEIFTGRYSNYYLKRDLKGLTRNDVNKNSNYLKTIEMIKRSKNVPIELRKKVLESKPKNTVLGHAIDLKINPKLYKDKYKDVVNAILTNSGNEYEEGS